jgi:hypothetical protein
MAQVAADPAPIEGGPEFFVVEGIAEGDLLNIRAAASATGKVVGRLPNGVALRNRGCSEVNGANWCKIEAVEDASITGWAAARYLRETFVEGASAEQTLEGEAQQPADADQAADFDWTGEVPCARYYGQPMSLCAARIKRGGDGESTVTVTWPDGGERIILFQNGRADASDAAEPLSWTREADLNILRIGKAERFEIADALAFGG